MPKRLTASEITREMCGKIILAAGLPMPKKSRCFMCPHQTAAEWLEVQGRPEEFQAAIALEREINEMDPEKEGTMFLYNGRVPLSMADFKSDMGISAPGRPCETGHCWT